MRIHHPVGMTVSIVFAVVAFAVAFYAPIVVGCDSLIVTFVIEGLLWLMIAVASATSQDESGAEILSVIAMVLFFGGLFGVLSGRVPC